MRWCCFGGVVLFWRGDVVLEGGVVLEGCVVLEGWCCFGGVVLFLKVRCE